MVVPGVEKHEAGTSEGYLPALGFGAQYQHRRRGGLGTVSSTPVRKCAVLHYRWLITFRDAEIKVIKSVWVGGGAGPLALLPVEAVLTRDTGSSFAI